MLSFLYRVFVDSWVGRIVAGLFFLAFIGFGVGDVLLNIGSERADVAARVGNRPILVQTYQNALQTEMPQVAQSMHLTDPSQIPPATRAQVAQQVLGRLMLQAEIAEAADRHGLIVPDSVVRNEIFSIPAFKGRDGQFDRALFNDRLRRTGMTEGRLIELVQQEQASRVLLQPIRDGVAAPDVMVRHVFDFEAQTRTIDLVRVPFAEQNVAATPTAAQLARYQVNHPWEFTVPEYRHARIVVLSADTIGQRLDVTDADLHQAYEAQAQTFNQPERRNVQIVTVPTEERARALAAQWTDGAAWASVQKNAGKDAAAVELPGIKVGDVPSADLGKQIFAAPADATQGPIKSEGGWVVFRVTAINAAHFTPFDEVKQALHDRLAHERARALLADRVQKLQDAIAGGGLDSIPTDLAATAVSGDLDARGLTHEGTPAPIPGSDAARQAIIARVFSQAKGANPELVAGPDGVWYAVAVDGVTPGHVQTLAEAGPKVAAAWQEAARRHMADQQATAYYTQATAQGGLGHVSPAIAGLEHSQPISPMQPAPEIPREVAALIFRLSQPGQSVMTQAGDAYVVATLTAINHPDPVTQKNLYDQVRAGLNQSMGDDIEMSYGAALEGIIKPKPNNGAIQAVMAEVTGQQNTGAAQ
ncbi:peptidylprolyl isomerase [Komagataeibacter nataicola]|uniref:Parvulin-like PPIase n=1 Tax=Komagataeibacter nataicola TaxID=265960 RepID=A0A9N7GZP1_9PROT|nr:peptidylprolyl isomerase [Komagataeibacter nataicola]AQU86667.1 peptidylprolyl isomerase [Komagataeibacter nataicola]PYD66821.1 peptidylprolyl isomerase [Komagataeibacter nataicola]WEQ56391.1 peptidyl-prolyl cis-trans isomerase [Komagataeibacter nataicola]GBR22297.1 peptidyl-prolyl cis-trans isomerase [Komagataeibacter nataicola NRIC 0616]